MTLFHILILSFVEGLTEFLPVSSTGHLILTGYFLNIEPTAFTKAFDIIIQFGAIFAVVILYYKRLKWDFDFYKKVFIAFIPAAVLGFLFKSKIDVLLESTVVVAWALIIGGAVLLVVDKITSRNSQSDLSEKNALLIGVIQCLAFIPGVSRSAATIIGGQIAGLTREKAAEFSFILAIPTLTSAALYKVWKIRDLLDSSYALDLGLGVLFSFIFALLAIRFFISILNRYGLKYFGYYRILLGMIVLYFHHRGQ